MRALLFASLVLACGNAPASAPRAEGEDRPDDEVTEPAPPIPGDVLMRVCAHEPCGGDEALVEVYRDASGVVRRLYRQYGGCSHSPGIYFDPTGTQTELIGEEPVVVGSPEQGALAARHARQVGALTPSEVVRCSDGRVLPPRARR